MKPLVAALLTLAILAAMLAIGSRQGERKNEPNAQPADSETNPTEEVIRVLIRAADAGDVDSYLAAFDGPLKARIGREIEVRGREIFAAELKRAADARKGHAIYAAEPEDADTAKVAVESIYPDRIERQLYRVVRSAEGWKVAEVATVRTLQPLYRFGTSVNPAASGDAEPKVSPTPRVGLTVESGDDLDPP